MTTRGARFDMGVRRLLPQSLFSRVTLSIAMGAALELRNRSEGGLEARLTSRPV